MAVSTFLYCFSKQLLILTFKNLIMGVKIEDCNLILWRIDYIQCSSPVFAMQAFGDVRPKPGAYYTQKLF